MRSKHIFVVTCLIVLLHLTHTNVESRNVANFGSLGYMPDEVALELKQMEDGYTAPRYPQQNLGTYANAYTRPESQADSIKEIKQRSDQRKNRNRIRHTGEREEDTDIEIEMDENPKKRFAIKDSVVIDFDELVNKVADKLKDDFEEKKKPTSQQKPHHGRENGLRNNPVMEIGREDGSLTLKNIYKFNDNKEKANEPREAWRHFMDTKSPKTAVKTSPSHTSHVRVPMKKSKKQVKNNDELFEIADLTKVKDSYEDYVTPKRDNIYASDTETESMNPLPKNEDEPKESYRDNEKPYEPKENYQENDKLQENLPKAADILKASKTSDKIKKIRKLDDPINFVKEDYDPNETEKPVDHSEKAMFVELGGDSDEEPVKMKGTMIPTRHFFKMSSPNYYGKLPAVAEKYDFNEPLPDKDREPEQLKPFFNPPARINKKVKLQANSEVEPDNE